MTRRWPLAALLLASLGTALAQPTAAPMVTAVPLTLDSVLDSSRERYPQVLAAREKIRAQAGKLLSSEGAFDLYAEQTNKSRLSGYYDGRYSSTKLVQPLSDFNTNVYGGYRVSGGDFPIYEDEAFTLDAGEFKVGAVFSLLRDRDIDSRRAGLRDSRLALDQTELDALLTRVRVQHDAMTAYVDWIAAGEALAVYRDLLQLAEARNDGLDTRVQEGDLANIYLNENRQYILRRRGFVWVMPRLGDLNGDRMANLVGKGVMVNRQHGLVVGAPGEQHRDLAEQTQLAVCADRLPVPVGDCARGMQEGLPLVIVGQSAQRAGQHTAIGASDKYRQDREQSLRQTRRNRTERGHDLVGAREGGRPQDGSDLGAESAATDQGDSLGTLRELVGALQRDTATEAVADDAGAGEAQRQQQITHRAGMSPQ